MKKIIKTSLNNSLLAAKKASKKVFDRYPRLKGPIKYAVKQVYNLSITKNSSRSSQYEKWVHKNYPDAISQYHMKEESKNFKYRPLISVIVPTYDTPESFFREMIESVLSQTYDNWELVLVDDCSPNPVIRRLIKEYADRDSRIKHRFLKKNHHISGATNEGFKIARGEFVALFDHDDLLWPNALYEVAKTLNNNQEIDFLYSDEDKVDEGRNEHFDPNFKPDYNPDMLNLSNYISHLGVIRKSIIDKVGGERTEYNGAQDHEFYLRLLREISSDRVKHLPTVLYSWRVHENSTASAIDKKSYVVEAQRKTIIDNLLAKGWSKDEFTVFRRNGAYDVDFEVKGNPRVSIIIPSKDNFTVTKRCLDSIFSKTTYGNYEVVLVDTGSTNDKVVKMYNDFTKKHDNFSKHSFLREEFSFSDACNYGVGKSKGQYVVMLNNDTEVITRNWLEKMLGDAQRPEIGVVGVKLLYPDKKSIQHAGVVVGLSGAANNLATPDLNYAGISSFLLLSQKRNVTAVTAACMMLSREKFEEVGGFNTELFPVYFNDIDLCLKLREKGYYNLYNPNVELVHHESKSLKKIDGKTSDQMKKLIKSDKAFKKKWAKYTGVGGDPMYNPNLTQDSVDPRRLNVAALSNGSTRNT